MITEQSPSCQPGPADCLDPCKSLSFQIINEAGGENINLPVAVKNLTTAGVILEVLRLENGFIPERFRGQEGFFTMVGQNDSIIVRVPGKILWTRTREGDAGITLGLELLEPLPLPVRHSLEADMSIGAKDMKVLWDYWDEIHEAAVPDTLSEPIGEAAVAARVTEPMVTAVFEQDADTASDNETRASINGTGLYWVGFGAILCGLAMQFLPSENIGLSGLAVMFLGSLVVALKSLRSMRQIQSPGPAD